MIQIHFPDAVQALLQLCNASIKTSFKEDGSIVTNFDIEIEKKIRDIIKHSFPNHSIIGEELVPHRENELYHGLSILLMEH